MLSYKYKTYMNVQKYLVCEEYVDFTLQDANT